MKRFRKILCCILCAAILAAGLSWRAYAEESGDGETGSIATPKAAVLMEAETGQVLYSVNAQARLPMASITKVMSLLVLADMIDAGELQLTDAVKASSYASSAEGSVIWLEAGEEMTAAELLEAVIVSSANDACIALAEHAAGSEAAFVKLMNKRAREMKLKNTKFTGCVGFDAEGHYSSAEDIAIMTAELMTKEYYRGWLLTWLDYLRGGETQLLNTNKLVRFYPGCTGLKTGSTSTAGYCLSATAEKDGMELIAVILKAPTSPQRFEDAKALLDYGFASYALVHVYPETPLAPVDVLLGTTAQVQPQLRRPCQLLSVRTSFTEKSNQ